MQQQKNKIAFVFPGQGSQQVGMLDQLAIKFPQLKQPFQQASDILGYDLWQLVSQGPEEILNQTERTQPALLVASFSIWRLWEMMEGQQPDYLAGHSLGEYTALLCARALDFTDAVQLVAARGRFMQQAVPESSGAMAAIIGLDDAKVNELCQQAAQGGILAPANFNAIGQTVVAGEVGAVERLMVLAEKAQARMAKRLPVSVPSHCELMKPAALQLAERLKNILIHKPMLPILHNVDVEIHQDADEIRDVLIKQLYSPVRWVETIQKIGQFGVSLLLECGPGKVLAGLNKRIDRNIPTLNLNTQEKFAGALEQLSHDNCKEVS